MPQLDWSTAPVLLPPGLNPLQTVPAGAPLPCTQLGQDMHPFWVVRLRPVNTLLTYHIRRDVPGFRQLGLNPPAPQSPSRLIQATPTLVSKTRLFTNAMLLQTAPPRPIPCLGVIRMACPCSATPLPLNPPAHAPCMMFPLTSIRSPSLHSQRVLIIQVDGLTNEYGSHAGSGSR